MTDQGDSTHRTHEAMEHQHRNIRDGGARAAVFGISDGLVSNVSLVLGIAAAHTPNNVVRLAGFAGLLGGAFSMAAGEYVSMRAQRELFEREIEIERTEIRRSPDIERQELATLYEGRGLEPALAGQLATTMMEDPDRALEAHAREELGIDPNSLGSPIQAALSMNFFCVPSDMAPKRVCRCGSSPNWATNSRISGPTLVFLAMATKSSRSHPVMKG